MVPDANQHQSDATTAAANWAALTTCIHCGAPNGRALKFCSACGAMLLRPLGEHTLPPSTIDVEDGLGYVVNDGSFTTPEFRELSERLEQFIGGEGSLQALLELYEPIRERLDTYFLDVHPETVSTIEEDHNLDPADPYARRMRYLLAKARASWLEGIAALESFLDLAEAGTMQASAGRQALDQVSDANVNLILAYEMAQQRAQEHS